MVIVGIDPGNTGAIAVVESGRWENVVVYDMPTLVTEGSGKTKSGKKKTHTVLDEQAIRTLLTDSMPIDFVCIEKSQSMPGQGVTSVANYMCGYGILRGICVGLGISYSLVHPATWRKSLMKDMDKGKQASIVRAQQLYPKAVIGKKDGRADALLIAHYGKLLGE